MIRHRPKTLARPLRLKELSYGTNSEVRCVWWAERRLPIGIEAETVVAQLQQAIDTSATGAVPISTASLGKDPAPGVLKHFAAIVEVNGMNYYFACEENQTINFNVPGSSGLKVKQAVFGGLKGGSQAAPEAGDVIGRLNGKSTRATESFKYPPQILETQPQGCLNTSLRLSNAPTKRITTLRAKNPRPSTLIKGLS